MPDNQSSQTPSLAGGLLWPTAAARAGRASAHGGEHS